jgi:hypothetical protein
MRQSFSADEFQKRVATASAHRVRSPVAPAVRGFQGRLIARSITSCDASTINDSPGSSSTT